ncbi:MAG: hypothetical protein ACD_65C00128G0006 [uncultured bacterium]|nr:MAG: hypothetical protein ACD_65C00128G0006 [uncultured bacterium]KKT02987.1 MAG: hypothetical protein UV80_C0001G0089 [Candidatus Peregrinibacteria bacterium GW2011_GWF2_43_17]HAU40331.1 hypothetical protein [Candidatus Peregrinibacteria bacterium]
MDANQDATLAGAMTNVGKKSGDASSQVVPDVRLADGGLAWYALLDQNPQEGAGVILRERDARQAYSECLARDSQAVESCRGKTWEEARKVLSGILHRDN